nr:hypothetical protein [Tanacetum cinerariifolium]
MVKSITRCEARMVIAIHHLCRKKNGSNLSTSLKRICIGSGSGKSSEEDSVGIESFRPKSAMSSSKRSLVLDDLDIESELPKGSSNTLGTGTNSQILKTRARGFVLRSRDLHILSFILGILYPNLIDQQSVLNQDSLIIYSSKIDSLLDEFAGKLILLKSIPSGIDEADCDPEE